jgi:outer membrane protein
MIRAAARRAAPWAGGVAAMCVMLAGSAAAESLSDAIALAYQSNPALLAARADLRALDERYIQAKAALGPTAEIGAQIGYEDAALDQPSSIFSPKTTTYAQATTGAAQLTINQPLYANGELSAALATARAQMLGGRESLRQQEAVVLSQVITAYADVTTARQLVMLAGQDVDLLSGQLAETQAKVDVRENTLTDRAQARARLTAAQLRQIQARNALSDAEARYEAAIGQAPGTLEPLPDLPGLPPNADAAFDAADRANPQLRAASYAELASRAAVAEAKAADGLRVGLALSVSQQPEYPYVPNLYARSAAAAIVVNKPLFTAGAHSSRVRQALETNNGDVLRLAEDQRQLIATVAQAWNDLVSRRRQLVGLNSQVDDEAQAFRGSQIEERIGLRTTIDVLNAEQEFQAAKIALAQTFHDEYLGRVSLLAAMGLLQAELITPDTPLYDPERSLDHRTAIERALPWEDLIAALDGLGSPHVATAPSERDPLGAQRPPTEPTAMPAAPAWSGMDRYLKSDLTSIDGVPALPGPVGAQPR